MRQRGDRRYPGDRRYRGWRLTGALAVAGALLAGCTGGGTEEDASGKGAPRPDAGQREAAPQPGGPGGPPAADASGAPGEGGEQDRKGAKGESEGQDTPPARPDFLSTFALDVDTASYDYARRTLGDGNLPAGSTVRPEEFVNSFRPGYPQPEGDGFTVTADGARTGSGPWSLLRVGLATKEEPPGAGKRRAPAALTFVIDISGSMAEEGRLDLVRSSLRTAVGQLRDQDSISLVTFSGDAETVLPMTRLDGDGPRDDAREAIDGLRPTDSTNLAAGMRKGYEEAVEGRRKGATNRVVLLSDALANTGDTSADAILEQVAEEREEHGITLFGVGVGSSYGDALMETLTNKGDGHTTYVSDREEAEKLFVDELPRNIGLRARDAKAQVAFEPSTVEEFRLIGYDNRKVADEDFRDDRVDGGEIGPGHTVTALYAVRLKEGAAGKVATSTVRWLEPESRRAHEESRTVDAEELRGTLWGDGAGGDRAEGDRADGDGGTAEAADPRLRLAAVAAYFAQSLRGQGQQLPDAPSLERLAGYARDIASATEDKEVSRLARIIDRADGLGAGSGPGAR